MVLWYHYLIHSVTLFQINFYLLYATYKDNILGRNIDEFHYFFSIWKYICIKNSISVYDYDTEDLKQMYKQFLGFFKLNKLMKIVFSELSKKCRIPCKQPIKCQEIKNKIHQTIPFLGGGSYFDTTYWIITEEPIIPLCKLTNGWHYNSPGLGAHWSVVVMENLVNNTGGGFSGWAVDADKRRTVLEKKHKTRSCTTKIYSGHKQKRIRSKRTKFKSDIKS